MSSLKKLTIVLTGTVAAFAWAHSASAADLTLVPEPMAEADVPLQAVSAVNGKWELDLGLLNSTGAFKAAGSLSVPMGDAFGLQGDLLLTYSGANGFTYGGALHAFTRDPSSYLFGVTAGVVVTPDASITAIGAEGELYLDRISLEGWAGLAAVDYYNAPPADFEGMFAFGDVAYYATDDLRLALGASYVLGESKAHLSAEYLMRDYGVPLSLSAEARIGASGNYSATIGLKGYFGGNDDNKSLIDRHRQDDPRNRALDLFTGAGSILDDDESANPYVDPAQFNNNEAGCLDAGYLYSGIEFEGGYCYDPEQV